MTTETCFYKYSHGKIIPLRMTKLSARRTSEGFVVDIPNLREGMIFGISMQTSK